MAPVIVLHSIIEMTSLVMESLVLELCPFMILFTGVTMLHLPVSGISPVTLTARQNAQGQGL